MRPVFVNLPNEIWWKLGREDPDTVPLRCLPDWHIVFPMNKMVPNGMVRETKLVPLDEVSCYFASRSLCILSADTELPVLSEKLRKVLNILRHRSRQAEVSTRISLIGFGNWTEEESISVERYEFPPAPSVEPLGFVPLPMEHWLDSAVEFKSIADISNVPLDSTFPVYSTLLLDSIDGIGNCDFRKAILFAAMAVEILASSKLEDAYSASKQEHQAAPDDPVYGLLKKRANAKNLVHEVSLYLLGRSLLLEDKTLYDGYLKLKRTRDKIAHTGEVVSGKPTFSLSRNGSIEAVRIAVRVLEWFGEEGGYAIPIPY